jgi:hypothetical protein
VPRAIVHPVSRIDNQDEELEKEVVMIITYRFVRLIEDHSAALAEEEVTPVPEKYLAAPQGFEPRYPAPEAGVLPLNEGAVFLLSDEFQSRSNRVSAKRQLLLVCGIERIIPQQYLENSLCRLDG